MWTLETIHPPGRCCFQPTRTLFSLIQDIIGMTFLTKFHDNHTINVVSRVHIWKNSPPPCSNNKSSKFHYDPTTNVASRVLTRKNAPPPRGHDFQLTGPIFEHVQHIIGTTLLTKFHEDLTINVAS
ncbi:hypothetical protein DPMN_038208 [Dreissena polymorpha]|uniref:Uncharacterized protein n=1 Tax=Dreissena polymorpha TaxID=45954 RepID=A0A9D4RMZ8_DREPO|nr:hypothetical protein DPMN_038208 [Dreissena polymorpha]